ERRTFVGERHERTIPRGSRSTPDRVERRRVHGHRLLLEGPAAGADRRIRVAHDRGERRTGMARVKNNPMTTQNPDKVAAFYKEAFGWKEIRRSPNGAVFLTDGAINVAILNWKTEKDADVGPNGPNYNGIHHFGVEVDDLGEASQRLDAAQAKR